MPKALTKEIKSIIRTEKSKTRKRLSEASTVEKAIAGGAGEVGAAGIALVDAYAPKQAGTALSIGPVPVGLIGGPVVAGLGLALGKGAIAAGVFGLGIGTTFASTYRLINDAATDHRLKNGKG